MMRGAVFASLCGLLAVVHPGLCATIHEKHGMGMGTDQLTFTIVYDNRSGSKGLESAWGFSCLVKGLDATILFDTGGDSPTLLRNMGKLGIAPESVDVIVLSHAHMDHVGGLAGFLEVHSDVTVYTLKSFPASIGDEARDCGAKVIEVRESVVICPGAASTGEMGGLMSVKEQSLVVTTKGGAIVVTGCSHPGIVSIVERAKTLAGQEILAILGGFHLFGDNDTSIRRVVSRLQELGVRYVAPCHCSGDPAVERFRTAYGERFIPCSVGKVIAVPDLDVHLPE